MPLLSLAEMERLMIKRALIRTGGNKAKAAQILGIDALTLWWKMKIYEKKRPVEFDFRKK